MSSRQGGKQKPLKAPKKDRAEMDEDDINLKNKLREQQKAEKEAIAKMKGKKKMATNAGGESVTDEHKKLVFSFIQVIRNLKTSSSDRIDAITHLLGEEFGVDATGFGGSHDSQVDLFEAFCSALKKKENVSDNDEKFHAFLDLLEKKGYFKGVEHGTPEYEARLEKAKQKFAARNNPYEGLTADQIKNKGNELMGTGKYKEAIAYYTKAIELEPENHIFFANRAAAHTHMKDYRSATIDCERAIAIKPDYSKAYSRLGTSLFYQENYARSVDAFSKACELEPDNARYKDDLKQAEEKARLNNSNSSPWGMGGPGGLPFGGPGMPDFSQISQMMSNPQFMDAAQRMMQNPQFSNLVMGMANQFGSGVPDPEKLAELMGGMASRTVNADGDVETPFGKVNREALEKLQQEETQKNPKFLTIMEDVRRNGFNAFQKYMGDPDVMDLMLKCQNLMMNGSGSTSS